MTQTDDQIIIIPGFIILATALAALIFQVGPRWVAFAHLSGHRARTTGVVLESWDKGAGKNTSRFIRFTYRAKGPDGKPSLYKKVRCVDGFPSYHWVRARDSIPILYDPANPSIMQIGVVPWPPILETFLYLVVLFIGLHFSSAGLSAFRPRRRKRRRASVNNQQKPGP